MRATEHVHQAVRAATGLLPRQQACKQHWHSTAGVLVGEPPPLLPARCRQAEKRRETLVVGLNKTKDALSVAEDKYKNLQLELQRTQMDLLAKTSKTPRHTLAAQSRACLGLDVCSNACLDGKPGGTTASTCNG